MSALGQLQNGENMNQTVKGRDTLLHFEETTCTVCVEHCGHFWQQDKEYECGLRLRVEEKEIFLPLSSAVQRTAEEIGTGTMKGFRVTYTGFRRDGGYHPVNLQTAVMVELSTGRVLLEAIPLSEDVRVEELCWPAPFEWKHISEEAVTVLPMMQGMILPNNWPKEVLGIEPFYFYDRAGYMPWVGQYEDGHGCLQIIDTPWDCGYAFSHPAGGPTQLSLRFRPSLGKIGYKRVIRMEFFADCDYNTFCNAYRRYLEERGRIKTLRQKALESPKLYRLAGSSVVHSYIKDEIKPEAVIYDHDNPQNNSKFATFAQRQQEIVQLKRRGLSRIYFHLDGWGVKGYDWCHPDILPPCEEAGGAEGMKSLIDTCKEEDILIALHDQYRDYYLDASSYDPGNGIHTPEQILSEECTWSGGRQNYLCASLAQPYVRRNYDALRELGIEPDGAYLDVFSIVPPDECAHPEHMMTRRECVQYRRECCELLRSRGFLLSSEEAADHLIPSIELCHHAPYPGRVTETGEVESCGIPVPLFNLVYHDCLMIPWHVNDEESGRIDGKSRSLYAILNAGLPYADICADEAEIELVSRISVIQERLCFERMVGHRFLNQQRTAEETVFSDGTRITVDFEKNSYIVEYGNGEKK